MTIERSIKNAAQSLEFIHAALNELDGSELQIPVVVKHRSAVASVLAKVDSYSDIVRFEQELLNALPAQFIGDSAASFGIVVPTLAPLWESRSSPSSRNCRVGAFMTSNNFPQQQSPVPTPGWTTTARSRPRVLSRSG